MRVCFSMLGRDGQILTPVPVEISTGNDDDDIIDDIVLAQSVLDILAQHFLVRTEQGAPYSHLYIK